MSFLQKFWREVPKIPFTALVFYVVATILWTSGIIPPPNEIVVFLEGLYNKFGLLLRSETNQLDQDVFEDGSEIGISTDDNQKVSLPEVAQLTNDSNLLEQAYVIDQTNAGLSEQRFGRLVSPVSGAALRIVGQSDNEVVAPFLEAVQSLLIGVIDNLGKQYETERYRPIRVRGKTHNLRPFNEIIKPEDIEGHGILSIELRAVQPENEAERWQAALLASKID
ncbi:MAG: hypothetical protein IIC75_07100, partial [Bacteroidetes bacterium]|nr:hypothetical protein [Bacteroidota bacterium]